MDDGYQFTLLIMKQLESQHSKMYQKFVAENHSISRSDPAFSRVSADTTLEQSPKPTWSQRVEVLAYAKVQDR